MHRILTPTVIAGIGAAFNIAPYLLVAAAIYWSLWWLVPLASPAILFHAAATYDRVFRARSRWKFN
jgi:hypothetical protein